jgi:hypothetical protein
MMPPANLDGSANTHAPLSQWQITSSYDTADACSTVLLAAQGYLPNPSTGQKTGPSRDSRVLNEVCISTDDPRLAK